MTQLFFGHLSRQANLSHAVTTREGGVSEPPYDSLNLGGHVGDNPAAVKTNRLIVAERLGALASKLVFMNQAHGNRVVAVSREIPEDAPECDALVTNEPGVTLGVMVADCIPLLFFDPVSRAVGVAHAGWKGTFAQIAARTVETMGTLYRTKPENLLVGIGPGIGGECYEVDDRVAHPWKLGLPAEFHAPLRAMGENRWKLDLRLANRLMLKNAGVLDTNIETMVLCSHCEPALFSYRREKETGRFAGLIGLKQ